MRSLNPSLVRLFLSLLCWLWQWKRFDSFYGQIFLSSIKYVHARQCDKARQQAETDKSVKERIANNNVHKKTGIINGVLFF